MDRDLSHILNSFSGIRLKELDALKLMNRTDLKFVFHRYQLDAILEHIKENYNCLQINKRRISSYSTLYYDTSDLKFYKEHHNGFLNRLKVRRRIYKDSNVSYLEVKFKNNKGRTIKERIKLNHIGDEFSNEELSFLGRAMDMDPATLNPIVWVDYQRITLAGKSYPERVTIDLNLQFRKNDQSVEWNDLVIAEVKQDKKSKSPFIQLMRDMKTKPNSISKYCIAVATTHKAIKQNNFKEKLYTLNQLMHHDSITSHN